MDGDGAPEAEMAMAAAIAAATGDDEDARTSVSILASGRRRLGVVALPRSRSGPKHISSTCPRGRGMLARTTLLPI
jgi:hypothetical protein